MSHIDQLRQVMSPYVRWGVEHGLDFTDDLLAATYPPACRTCHGTQIKMFPPPILGVDCPDCPTIAQLLAWGVAVATAETDGELRRVTGNGWMNYADDLLDAIRAVQPASASEAQP